MKYLLTFLALGATASALNIKRAQQCCFQLTASGGVSGSVGQLQDGQLRVGNGIPAGTYCIDTGTGTISDSSGKACLITSPTSQFQCDAGGAASSGFSITSSGTLQYSGSSIFYACPATDTGDYNIYAAPVSGQSKCVQVSLSTSGQCTGSSTSTAPSVSSSASGQTSGVASSSIGVGSSSHSSGATVTTVVVTVTAGSSASSQTSGPASSGPSTGSSGTSSTTVVTVTKQTSSSASSAGSTSGQSSGTRPVTTVIVTVSAGSSSVIASQSSGTPSVVTICQQSSSCHQTSQTTTVTVVASTSGTSVGSSVSTSSSVGSSSTSPSTRVTTVTVLSSTSGTSVVSSTAASSPASSSTTCPTDLSGAFQVPHLIVPVSSSSPNQAYGTSYTANISSTISTIFNFDIPSSYAGKTCQLEFLFPTADKLLTSGYTLTGSGAITFSLLTSPATSSTTYNTVPAVSQVAGIITPQAGTNSVVATVPCQPGTYGVIASGSGTLDFSYFQDYNPAPIGLYVAAC